MISIEHLCYVAKTVLLSLDVFGFSVSRSALDVSRLMLSECRRSEGKGFSIASGGLSPSFTVFGGFSSHSCSGGVLAEFQLELSSR